MSTGRVLSIIRNYSSLNEPCIINLIHVVSVSQKNECLFFQTIGNRNLTIIFNNEANAKREMDLICETLNAFMNTKEFKQKAL